MEIDSGAPLPDDAGRMGDREQEMAAITVTVRLSAESAAFIRKCIGDANPVELDEFFEAAIAALAASILELDKVMTGDEFRSLRNH